MKLLREYLTDHRTSARRLNDPQNKSGHLQTDYSVSWVVAQPKSSAIWYVQDLLRPDRTDLALREGKEGVYMEGVHEAQVRGARDCLRLLQRGDRNR